jgi:hypothetical protein
VSNKGLSIQNLISVYTALGGGWQSGPATFVDAATREQMERRTDWDDLLEADRQTISDQQ